MAKLQSHISIIDVVEANSILWIAGSNPVGTGIIDNLMIFHQVVFIFTIEQRVN